MLTLFALILIKCLWIEGKLFGDHVCQTEINEPREVLQWELKNRTVRTYKWCMNVPPRCSVYSNKVYNETKYSVINSTRSIETCCDGFHEHNSYCISKCQDCKHGLCLKETCICQNGWHGLNCDARVLNSDEDILTTKTINVHDASESIASTTRQIRDEISSETIQKKNTFSLSPTTSISTSTDLQGNTISSTTNLYSSLSTLTQYFNETSTTPIGEEKMPHSLYGETFEISSPRDRSEFSDEISFLEYGTHSEEYEYKNSEEELAVEYSTGHVYLDTTVTQPTVVSTTSSINTEEVTFSSSEKDAKKTSYYTLSSSENVTTISTSPVATNYPELVQKNPKNEDTNVMLEHSDSDVDYRELGGQSFEEKSMEIPEVLQHGSDKNNIHMNVLDTTRNNNGFRVNLEENIEKNNNQNVLETVAPVLDKPRILKDEKENSIFKETYDEDFTEGRYEKRSSNKNYSQNTLLTKNEPDNNNLIYSVCAASATTVIILVVAIIIFTFRNARKKVDKNKGKKDVATVAVYTTSIFHSPLPDPPTFENLTYLSTVGNDSWNKEQNEEMIEVQEFNVVFQKPIKNPKLILDSKQYLYDHPPSTGSYRASSEVDTLSQYNLSQSMSGVILEPLYDEIPSRDTPVDSNEEHDATTSVDSPKNNLDYLDNNSLYVNTFGRTMF